MNPADRSVALVVGGGGSIGAAVSDRLAAEGFEVVVASRNPPAGGHERLTLDITDLASCRQAAADVEARFGRLDCLVNSASIATGGLSGPFAGTDPTRFDEAVRGSITATFNLVHSLHPLLAVRGGAVLQFASDAALFASRNQAIVGPTRAAIVGFVRNYALEAAAVGIRINAISLSYVRNTAIFDRLSDSGSSRIATAAARAGLGLPEPGDIAPLAAFLCSGAAHRITGQVVSVNGGLSA